jgi:hypothetical protein
LAISLDTGNTQFSQHEGEREPKMQTRVFRTLTAGACLLLAVGAAQAADGVKWQTSYKTALAKAKKTHKTVVVDFYAEW